MCYEFKELQLIRQRLLTNRILEAMRLDNIFCNKFVATILILSYIETIYVPVLCISITES